MNIGDALQTGAEAAGRRDAVLILAHALKIDPADALISDPNKELTLDEEKCFVDLIEKRQKKMPTQYILGKWEFMGLPFAVGPGVLIPRADTEILVETVLEYKPKKILDLCTGSGCIAVALASMLPDSRITATDISAEALRYAKKNAEDNNVADRINFIRSDMFCGVSGVFDCIVSNPPYIPSFEIDHLPDDVRIYEPHSALDGGADGLLFYGIIFGQAKKYLKNGGLVFTEVGPHGAAAKIMRSNGYVNVSIINDYSGKPRVLCGCYSKPPEDLCSSF